MYLDHLIILSTVVSMVSINTTCQYCWYEQTILWRLTQWMETNQLLAPNQFGFLLGRGTADAIAWLDTNLREYLSRKMSIIVIFLDISKAFDTVSHAILHAILKARGIQGRILNWITKYDFNREIQITLNEEKSEITRLGKGLPQGCISSPMLYNIYTSELLEQMEGNSGGAQYADDIILWAAHENPKIAQQQLQHELNGVKERLKKLKLEVNPDKSAVICFSRKKNHPKVEITWEDKPIAQVSTKKYMGIEWDQMHQLNAQIHRLVEICGKYTTICRFLTATKWGYSCMLSGATELLMSYRSLIRAQIDYASPLYEVLPKTKLNKIQTLTKRILPI